MSGLRVIHSLKELSSREVIEGTWIGMSSESAIREFYNFLGKKLGGKASKYLDTRKNDEDIFLVNTSNPTGATGRDSRGYCERNYRGTVTIFVHISPLKGIYD